MATFPHDWREGRLGDFITLQRGIDITRGDLVDGDIPVISSSGIVGYHNQAIAEAPGVITGRKGLLGQVYYIDKAYWPHDTTLWVKDFKGNYPRFVYYFLKTLDFLNMDVGSSNPTLNRNHVHPIRVMFPPPIEQRAIAHILGTLDDRIELNRQMNTTLEEIARAIFQSWFVDFDPVRAKMRGEQPYGIDAETAALFPDSLVESELGEIPAGWEIQSLYESATYINGAAFKDEDFSVNKMGLPVIKIAELKYGVTNQTRFTEKELPPKYLIETGDILFSWSGSPETSIDTFIWSIGPAWLNQHIFKVLPRKPQEKVFIYILLRHLKPLFIEIARDKQTTGLGHVTVQDMKRLLTVWPPDDVLNRFAMVADPVFASMLNNELQRRTLVHMRDTLLPKLISGQIRISDINL